MMRDPQGRPRVPHASAERPIGELFADLAQETSTLVRQEVKLAGAELAGKATYAAKQAALLWVGALLAVVAVFTLAGAAVLGLGAAIPLWASALLVGFVLAGAGFALGMKGLNALRNVDPRPEQTLQSLTDTKQWIQHQIH